MPRELYDFQKTGLNFLRVRHRAILADEMGLGKSVQALMAAWTIYEPPFLIITKKTIKESWRTEIEGWLGVKPTLVSGTIAQQRKILQGVSKTCGVCIVIHYQSMATLLPELLAISWTGFIIDEAHALKNRKALVTKAAMKLTRHHKNAFVFFLTGTPILSRCEELWTMLHMIDPITFSSFWKWVAQWLVVTEVNYGKSFAVKKIGGPKDPEAFRKTLSQYLLRRTKEDVNLQLPEKTFQTINVLLEGEQKKAYSSMFAQMYTKIKSGEEVAVNNAAAQTVRLRQIAISHHLLDPNTEDIAGAKIDALEDILEGIGDQKALIFSNFAQCLTRITKRLRANGYKIAYMDGSTSEKKRNETIKQFQEDLDTKILITTLKEGYTVTEGSVVIFMDLDWVPAMNDQAIGRIERIGQKNVMTIYNIEATKTIEARVNRVILKKRELFENAIPKAELLKIILESPTGEYE